MPNADPKYATRMEKLNELVLALNSHPSMEEVVASIPSRPNRPDGRSVPAVQNSVYFLWDFVCRTRYMLEQIEPSLDAKNTSPKIKQNELDEQWTDVVTRCWLTKTLICDDPSTLAMMMGKPSQTPPEFGENIKNLAKELAEA